MPALRPKINYLKQINKDILLISIILILTILVNINLFKVPFIFDDYDFLFHWETIRSFTNIPSLLLGDTPSGHGGVYRPLRSIFYTLSLRFFDHNLLFYHLQELFIYSLCITFVYLITQKMFGKRPLSFLTTLFFAILPLHIDNLANLTGSFDTIGVIFFFLSFYLFQHYTDSPKHHKNIFLWLSLAASFAAYATYEITLVLPLLLFLYVFYQHQKLSRFVYIAFILCAVIFLFLRITLLRITTRGTLFDNIPYKTDNTVKSLSYYLLINFLPIEAKPITLSSTLASLDFSQAKENAARVNIENTSFFLSLIFLIATIAVAVKNFLKHKISGFGFTWFYIALIPAMFISLQSSLIKGNTQPLWPRYSIIASYGTCLLLANLLLALFGTRPAPVMNYLKITGITCIIVLTILNAAYSFNNLKYWQDPIPGLLIKIQQLKKEDEKHNDLGVVYASEKRFNDSITEFQTALKINPKYTKSKQNLDKLCQIIKKIEIDAKTKNSCP